MDKIAPVTDLNFYQQWLLLMPRIKRCHEIKFKRNTKFLLQDSFLQQMMMALNICISSIQISTTRLFK